MQITEIKIDQIQLSGHNGDRAKDVKSLAESIKAVGLINPIAVRRIKIDGKTVIEVVAGHRRLAAAKLAGLKAVPTIEVPAEADKAELIKITENIQRLQLTALQEADAISKLRKLGRKTEEIAADLGMRPQYIARREKLLSLIPEWQKRWAHPARNELSLAAVELIALQEMSVQKLLLEKFKHWSPDAEQVRNELSSLNNRLSNAPWDLKDMMLLPMAGACVNCPKRSSCQPLLFHDEVDEKKISDQDRCLDIGCWNKKREAYFRQKLDLAKVEHPDVVLVKDKSYDFANSQTTIKLSGKETVLESHQYSEAKKGDRGAKPAVVIDGKKPGRLIYISKGQRSTSTSSSSPAKKSLSAVDDRRARRAKLIINELKEKLFDTPEGLKDQSPENALRMMAAVSLYCDRDHKDPRHEGKRWHELSKFKTLNLAKAIDQLWPHVRREIYLPVNSFADALKWIGAVKPFAETVMALDWKKIEADALAKIPDPKPKAGSPPSAKKTTSTKKAKAKK